MEEAGGKQHDRIIQYAYTVLKELLNRFLLGQATMYATRGKKQQW